MENSHNGKNGIWTLLDGGCSKKKYRNDRKCRFLLRFFPQRWVRIDEKNPLKEWSNSDPTVQRLHQTNYLIWDTWGVREGVSIVPLSIAMSNGWVTSDNTPYSPLNNDHTLRPTGRRDDHRKGIIQKLQRRKYYVCIKRKSWEEKKERKRYCFDCNQR